MTDLKVHHKRTSDMHSVPRVSVRDEMNTADGGWLLNDETSISGRNLGWIRVLAWLLE